MIGDRDRAFRLEHLSVENFLQVYDQFRDELTEALLWLSEQKTVGPFSRDVEHRPDLLDALASLSGQALPQPSYFDPEEVAREEMASDHWLLRQPSHPIIDWKRQHRDGFVRFVWPNPKIDLSSLPSDPEGFVSALTEQNVGQMAAHRLYRFVHGMKTGDAFVVADGPYGYTFAAGSIAGPYEYIEDDLVYPHHRSISVPEEFQQFWLKDQEGEIEKLRYGWGPMAISASEHEAMSIQSAERITEVVVASKARAHLSSVSGALSEYLNDHFSSQGLTYTRAQLATFCTALQTKGFVVLSGISGTGKSKIAQGFVDLLPQPDNRVTDNSIDPESVISVTVKPYMRNYRRIVIPVKQEVLLPDIEKGKSITLQLSINGTTEKARLSRRQDTGSLYLYFRQAIGEEVKALDLGQPLYLRPMVTGDDDETLALIEMFTDPAQLPIDVRLSNENTESRNSLFLAVRPDWRDSTSLLGYYNPLTETYEWTEFLRFLLRAVKDFDANGKDALAWFVILDEMNLAHVEYYFADLLSIIESGRDEKGWSREPIRLTYPDAKTDNPPPHEISLPPNLYIIGTVNMDETTHAFSPKVLDRAFTIELTDVDFTDYPPLPAASDYTLGEDERRALLKAFTRDGRFAQVSKDDIRQAVDNHPEMRRWLHNLNTRLARDQFHFGYRVFDEIAQFIYNADENGMFVREGVAPSLSWQEAFDHAVYMKVLPKFNGSHARLIGPLTSLLDWARNPDAPMDGQSAAEIASQDDGGEEVSVVGPAPRLERVAKRAKAMIDILEANGFVSFG